MIPKLKAKPDTHPCCNTADVSAILSRSNLVAVTHEDTKCDTKRTIVSNQMVLFGSYWKLYRETAHKDIKTGLQAYSNASK
eukprot:2831570-Amphidinium_carterae.1